MDNIDKRDFSVIFDMDGVIFDSERACVSCWGEVAKTHGIYDIDEVFISCIGTNKNQTRIILSDAYAEEFGPDIVDVILTESSALFHSRYDNGNLPVKAGVVEILELLKEKGIKTGVASSTRKAVVEAELRDAHLLSFFDMIIGGDAVKISKPDPEIYLMSCEQLGSDPSKTFAIEDSYNGIRSAHAAGMRPIMVPDMIPADDEMKSLSEIVCSDLYEVKKYFERFI